MKLQILDSEEAAKLLNTNSQQVRRWIRKGLLKAKWMNGVYALTREDVERFGKNHRWK